MSSSRYMIVAAVLGLAASSTAQAVDPFTTLGAAGDYTLVSLADSGSGSSAGFLQLGSAAHVYGTIGGRYRVETASGVVVEGDAHYGDGGSLHGGTILGSDDFLDTTAWSDLYADAAATIDGVHDLDATTISGAPTEQCTGDAEAVDSIGSHVLSVDRDSEGLSVYEIDGCLFLGSGETLLIEGTAEDRFVIRVTGGMRLERGSAILLDGIPGSAVLFSLEGGGWTGEPWAQVTAEDGSDGVGAELSGVFVSPDMFWQLGDGTVMPDTRIIAGGVQANIQDMYSTDTITGSPLEDDGEDGDCDGDDGDDGGDDGGGIDRDFDREHPGSSCGGEDTDGPCPWLNDRCFQGGNSTNPGGSSSQDMSVLMHDDATAGCSAVALGASWLWFVGAGFAVTRRRRQD